MIIFALPARVILVGIKPPAKNEMLAVLVAFLFGLDGLFDYLGQLAVGLIAAFVGSLGVLGVCLNARQGCPSLA